MSDDRARLDPRFDPAFQRGFDGVMPSGSGSTPPPSTVAPSSPVAPTPPSTPEPRALPREEAPLPAAAPASAPRTLLTPDAFVADEPRRVNPWLIALGAVSVVLTLGGLLLITRLRDLFADTQNSAEFDYVVLQSLIIGAPILVGLGLATGIGLLFVLAVRRSR